MKRRVMSIVICLLMITSISAPISQNNGQPQNAGQLQNIGQSQNLVQPGPNPTSGGSGGLADSPWPMFRGNLNHTGLSPYDTSTNTGQLKWSFQTIGNDYIDRSSPAIDANGTIYIGSTDPSTSSGYLYAINPDGTEKWSFTSGNNFHITHSSPAIGSDETIYIGSDDHKLYAINPDGTERWSFTTGERIWSSPAVGSDGTIYVGSNDDNLYAINHDGTEKWIFPTGNSVESSPAIGLDGTIYVGSNDYNLYAINPDGSEKWKYSTGYGVCFKSPAIGSDGTIYIASDSTLYALNPDGSNRWNHGVGHNVRSPAIGPDGTIYFSSETEKIHAIYPNGAEKWRFPLSSAGDSIPSIGSDGTLYVGSDYNNIYAINPDGTEKWHFITPDGVESSPAIDSDGTIYVGSNDGKLYAFGNPSLIVNVTSHFSELNSAAQSAITVHVTDGTNLVQGATVNIASDTGGIFSPQSGITDANGEFKSIFNTPTVTSQIICRISAEASKTGYNNGSGYVDVTINPIPWPMFRHNLNHTGVSPYDTSSNPGKLKWSFEIGDYMLSSPAIGSDGTIYIGSRDNKFYAINPDGTEQWNFLTGGLIDSSPAIGSDRTIYVGSNDWKLYAINPDGSEKWSFMTGKAIDSSPVIGSDGTIYVGSRDHKLYAINPDGTEKWSFTTGNGISFSSAGIDSDGTIYIGSTDNKLYAVYPNGTEKWSFETGNYVISSPAIGFDGTIYVASLDRKLYAINHDGSEKWNIYLGHGTLVSSPAIGFDGTIYLGSSNNKLYAFNPDGTEKWNFTTMNHIFRSSPAIGSDGTIYIGSYDFRLYAINPDGTQKWNFLTGWPIEGSPAIGSDGTIYMGSSDCKLYAIGSSPQNQPPVSDAGPDQIISEGDTVQFDGSASYDPDGTIVSYEWDFDSDFDSDNDGDPTNDVDATGPTPTHIYGDDGVYCVTLRVTDDEGLSDTDASLVTVENIAPHGSNLLENGDFSKGTEGWYHSLHGYTTPSSIPPLPPSRYFTSTDNGHLETGAEDGYNQLYQDVEVNTTDLDFHAKFRAVDFSRDGGLVEVKIRMFCDKPPGWSGNPPNYSNLSIIQSLIVGQITWYFRPDHIYPSSGTSYWELLGTGPSDWYVLDVNLHDVIVANLPGIDESQVKWLRIWAGTYGESGGFTIGYFDDFSLERSIIMGPNSTCEGENVIFTARAADPGSDDLIFTWDWGDGTSDTATTHHNNGVGPEPVYDPATNGIKSPWGTYPFAVMDTVIHTYGDDGIYNVTITIEDDDGGVSTYSMKVTVQNVAPAIEPFGPLTIDEGSPFDITATSFDPGSDDLTFVWEFEDGPTMSNIHHNDGMNPDPYPSPWGTYPFSAADTAGRVYGDDGNFTITLTTRDDDGGFAVYETYILVNNVPPTITFFNHTILMVNEPRTVGYWGHQCEVEEPYGDHTGILQEWIDNISSQSQVFSWISTKEDVERIVQSGDASEMIVMAQRQLMGVWLNVVTRKLHPATEMDMPNLTASKTVWEAILEIEDVILNSDNRTELERMKDIADNINNGNGIALGIVEFTASATDPGADDLTFHWDFGDGKSQDNYYPNPGGVFPIGVTDNVVHSYFSLGTFTVTLTVSDDDGGSSVITQIITF